jgi:hypothetical protein
MAAFLEGAFLLGLALVWQASPGERPFWGISVILLGYGLLLTGSRGAWVGLGAALGIWALLLIPSLKVRLMMIATGVVGGALAVWLAAGRSQLPGLASMLDTAHNRLVLYNNSLYLLADYPFTGIGLGNTFAMVYSRYQLLIRVPFLSYAHNLILSVGLGLGLLGLLALAWLLIAFYRFVSRVERTGPAKEIRPLFQGAWLGVTATFLHGLTDAPQFSDPGWTMPVLFALLGLVVASGRMAWRQAGESEPGAPTVNQPGRREKQILLAALLVLLVSALLVFHRPLLGAWYANLGALHQTWADLSPDLPGPGRESEADQARAYFQQALIWHPAQATANRRFGQMALEREQFDIAVTYLERAYRQQPNNQATLKALGYAYVWTDRPDEAEALLRQRDDLSEVIEELGVWSWWWDREERPELSVRAAEMARRLNVQQ